MRAHPAGARHAEMTEVHSVEPVPSDSVALHALDPAVWPSNAARTSSGGISIAGCDITDLIEKFGTPLLVCDERDFRARCQNLVSNAARTANELGVGFRAYYAAKAFLCGQVAQWVQNEGLGVDVCSAGELAVALRSGFDPQQIIMHGNNKSEAYLAAGLQAGVGRIVVDSFTEIDRLAALTAAADHGQRRPEVLVRVTVGVEAHTHEYIATAHEDQKFGFSLAVGQATLAIAKVLEQPGLQLMGLHSHIGSQIFDPNGFEVAAHRMVGLMLTVRDEFGITLNELNMGGGFGIAYTSGESPLPAHSLVSTVLKVIAGKCVAAGLPCPQVAFEPGRSLIGPSMVSLYRVGTVKTVALDGGMQRSYISVDGGMSDNIRPALYGAVHTVSLANRMSSAAPVQTRVVGPHCETGDVLVTDAWLAGDIVPGDVLAVASTGAYCYAMSSNYNLVPRPAVVAVREGRARPMVRRQSWDDVVAQDCVLNP